MELKNTVELMCSSDYKDRFKAEYLQTKIRYNKLSEIISKMKSGTIDFNASCSLEILVQQECAMKQYLNLLEIRAEIEKIDIRSF